MNHIHSKKKLQEVFIGTSGYNYKDWIGIFYPKEIKQKDWLSYYSSQFSTVEINATFYRNFERNVFIKWKTMTRDNFYFSIKGPRVITHIKRLHNIDESLEIFLRNSSGLDEKLRIILWQFPSTFVNNEQNFKKLIQFLNHLPASRKHVFEFRNATWFTSSLYTSLNRKNMGFVINDTIAFDTTVKLTDNIAYIRFHGPTSLYNSSYSKEQLQKWATKISQLRKSNEVFCYFNNDFGGNAIRNAIDLQKFLDHRH